MDVISLILFCKTVKGYHIVFKFNGYLKITQKQFIEIYRRKKEKPFLEKYQVENRMKMILYFYLNIRSVIAIFVH